MIPHIKNVFRSSVITDESVIQKIRQTNITRSIVITSCAVLFSFVAITFFSHDVYIDTSIELIKWRKSIILLNFCMLVINLVFLILAFLLYRLKKAISFLYIYLPYILLGVISFWGITGCVLHQLISRTIIPFILVTFAASTLLIRPALFVCYCLIIYGVLFFCISIYQSNLDYIYLNRILGLVAITISYCISRILWNNSMVRFEQNRLIELQTQELKEANTSKNKFFSILSHDLKGPIASSLLLTELLEEETLAESERKEINQMFRSGLENISRLIDNVLLWANSQTGNISFNPVYIDLKKLVDENIQLLHTAAILKKINITNAIYDDVKIHADPHMMHTVFRNLLANAIKFTHEHGNVSFSVEPILSNSHIKIHVVDDGIGMSPEFANNLFRIDKKTMAIGTKEETGTGLGLILCKDFLEKHQGQLEVQSKKGEGSCFIITLPYKPI